MKRRTFLLSASLAGISLPLSLGSCNGSERRTIRPEEPNHRAEFELDEESIESLQKKMADGELSSKEIVQRYLDRIESVDRNGPRLNAVIEINPDAISIAEDLDEERKNGKIRGPLHGIPVLIKDNIDTSDKMLTTAGSLAMMGNRPVQDAFIVKKLRDAGGVILGKTNLSEWANFRSARSSSGWSSRGGQTKNPFILDRNPCGSSSGSGTAVSANLCTIAIGTETNGSIACPSSINGVVGLKPTVGLWSRSGIIPISHTQDTAGPMTRTVRDAAILLGALAGMDENDPATIKRERKNDYTQYLRTDALKGKRIGVEKKFMHDHEAIDGLLQIALRQLRDAGAEVVETEFVKKLRIEGAEYEVLQFEFKNGLDKYLARSNASVKSLSDVIAFNRENEASVMPFFKQEILESSEKKGGLDSKEYRDALEKIIAVRTIIDAALEAEKLDAICGPANGPAWCTDLVNGDFFTGYGMYSAAAMAGYPHITVPMGQVQGLPVGLCFFNSAFQEAELIAIAYSYEQLSKNRVKPGFQTSFEDEQKKV